MSLLFMDSFDHYATADITEKWTAASVAYSAIGAYGRNGTNGLRLQTSSVVEQWVSATVLGGVTEAIIGVALTPSATWGASFGISAIWFGSASKWECGVVVNADLTLQAIRADGTIVPGTWTGFTRLGSASSVALQAGVSAYVEVRMKCDDSTGSCVIRINGVEVVNATGLDTKYDTATLTRVALAAGVGTTYRFDVDDLVVMDTTGATNNTFLGDVTVTALYPSGAGTTSGWTPSAGSNYQNVDESPANDDTDYNATATLNAKDTYAMQDCAAGADIRAVQILAAVRKGAEGPGQVKLVTRSASTDYDGAAQGIGGTSYSYVREIRETDPATAAAWSESGWNAVEIGLKKTA